MHTGLVGVGQGITGAALRAARARGAPAASTYEQTILNDNPVAYWRLEDVESSISDEINNITGTLLNNTVNGAGIVSGSSGSVSMDNSNGGITLQDNAVLKPTSALTYEVWVQPSSTQGGSNALGLYNKESNGPWNGLSLRADDNTEVRLAITTDTDGITSTSGFASSSLLDDQIHHIIGTWDGSTVRVYVDGVEVGSSSVSGTAQYTTEQPQIGYRADDTTHFVNGLIDEVAIYDYALTAQQIQDHYNVGTSTSQKLSFATMNAFCIDYVHATNPTFSASPKGQAWLYSKLFEQDY